MDKPPWTERRGLPRPNAQKRPAEYRRALNIPPSRRWGSMFGQASERCPLTAVVKYDNIGLGGLAKERNDSENTAHFMGQGGAEGIRNVPGRCQVYLPSCPD